MTTNYRRYSYDERTCRTVQKRRLKTPTNGRQANFTMLSAIKYDHMLKLIEKSKLAKGAL